MHCSNVLILTPCMQGRPFPFSQSDLALPEYRISSSVSTIKFKGKNKIIEVDNHIINMNMELITFTLKEKNNNY